MVTKTDLVEKDMELVEKLQMTSRRDLSLPLGCVHMCMYMYMAGGLGVGDLARWIVLGG